MKRERENSEVENASTKKMKKGEFVKTYSESLLKACSQGKTDLARMLCANGADPNVLTDGKREPPDTAYLEELREKKTY